MLIELWCNMLEEAIILDGFIDCLHKITLTLLDKTYDKILRNKVDRFRIVTSCKKSIQLTMITTYGVKKNKYSNLIGNQVLLDDLFI